MKLISEVWPILLSVVTFVLGVLSMVWKRAREEQRNEDRLTQTLTLERARELFLTRDEQTERCGKHAATFDGRVNVLEARLNSQAAATADRFVTILRAVEELQAGQRQILDALLKMPKRHEDCGE